MRWFQSGRYSMNKVRYYVFIGIIGLCSCSALKHQEQQSSLREQRQVQVSARADSIQWDGHLGKWSVGLKAGRYEVRLDSSTRQKQQTKSSVDNEQRSLLTYVWWGLGGVLVMLGLFWGAKRWLKHTLA